MRSQNDPALETSKVAGQDGVMPEPPVGIEPTTFSLRVRRSNRLS